MSELLINNGRILTLKGAKTARRGEELHDLGVVLNGWISIKDGIISAVGSGYPVQDRDNNIRVIDGSGCVVMPAFVDCHTHTCWAGERYDEFDMKLVGKSYLEILAAGGGIMSTVRTVRNATEQQLTDLLLMRLSRMRTLGTATVEIKSGYGLSTKDELKMLRAIHKTDNEISMTLMPTFLGAHAIDKDNPDFIEETIKETLPIVAKEFPGITCDAYCEEGAWSLDETRQLFETALAHNMKLRVHTDQFNSLGMTKLAIEMGAVSVDHLEAVTDEDMKLLAASNTIGVMLPCSGFQLDARYAQGRKIIDAGCAIAIATNYNPGSAPTPSMPFTIALSCRKLGLTPAEAIVASTFNAACVLNLENEIGSIEAGKKADIQILDCEDERELGYEFAGAGPRIMIINGKIIQERHVL